MHQAETVSSNRRSAIFIAIAFALGVALSFAGLTLTSAMGNGDAVVTVNGEPITREAFYERLELEAGEEVLDQMIAELLVAQTAERYDDVVVTVEEIQAEIDDIKRSYGSEEAFNDAMARFNISLEQLERDIRLNLIINQLTRRGIEVTDEEIQEYYDANREALGHPEQVQVRHILVDTKEEAEAIAAQLANGADFAELARIHSIDTGTAENGGLVGYLHANSPIVPSFKEAALKLQVGEVSDPVESDYGWHVIRADDRIEAQDPTLDEARDFIREVLINEKARPVSDILSELWMTAVVEVHWPQYEFFAHDPQAVQSEEGSEE